MAHYLICYDIADPKRLAKVHRKVVNHAVFVQLSVYYLAGERQALLRLLDELKEIIDERADDVRAYTVGPLSQALQMGKAWLPEGLGFII